MSLFGKLLGRKPFETLKAEADALREGGQHGAAKLAYEKARDARDAPPAQREAMQQAVNDSCDAIAQARMAEATRLLEEGHLDLAFEELDHALETAASAAVRDRVQAALELAQRDQFRTERVAQTAAELDDDARYETLTGHWDMAQHAEYADYGEPFKRAVLALNDGQTEIAREALEALVLEAKAPRYLWLEVARARVAAEADEPALEALERFLAELEPDEGGDARLSAHVLLANLRAQRDDLEGALGEYQAALEAMPEDPRVYLAMGHFLRVNDMPEEAVDVLQSGIGILEEGQAHFRLWLECGLSHAAAGQQKPAIHWLEQVVDYFAARQAPVPEEAACTLAGLYEQAGNLTRAADLFRHLAEDAAAAASAEYHGEAARLLLALGIKDEARRMLLRAREALAAEDAEGQARIAALLAQTDA